MSYTMIVQHNIKLKADTPKNVLHRIRDWHRRPYAHNKLEIDHGIDVYRAFGAGCGKYGNLVHTSAFNSGDGVVSHIRTTALFSRGKNGADSLLPLFEYLAEYVSNTDEVIAVIRGEDNLHNIHEDRSYGFGLIPQPEPAYSYYEVRIVNGRVKMEFVSNDIYELLPWVTYAY